MYILQFISGIVEFCGLSWLNYPIEQMANAATYFLDLVVIVIIAVVLMKIYNYVARDVMGSPQMRQVVQLRPQCLRNIAQARRQTSPKTARRSQRLANKRNQ